MPEVVKHMNPEPSDVVPDLIDSHTGYPRGSGMDFLIKYGGPAGRVSEPMSTPERREALRILYDNWRRFTDENQFGFPIPEYQSEDRIHRVKKPLGVGVQSVTEFVQMSEEQYANVLEHLKHKNEVMAKIQEANRSFTLEHECFDPKLGIPHDDTRPDFVIQGNVVVERKDSPDGR